MVCNVQTCLSQTKHHLEKKQIMTHFVLPFVFWSLAVVFSLLSLERLPIQQTNGSQEDNQNWILWIYIALALLTLILAIAVSISCEERIKHIEGELDMCNVFKAKQVLKKIGRLTAGVTEASEASS
jgi:uncharacterized membrane protein YozB (DUF420 family)